MSDQTKPPVILRFPDRPADDLDRLLHAFFRSEMPEPWPAWSPPAAKPDRPTVRARFRGPALRRRLVVAASVAVLLVGYLALARSFPGSSDGAAPFKFVGPDHSAFKQPVIPKARLQDLLPDRPQPKTVPVPRGGSARMWEQHLPDRSGRIELQIIPDR